MIKIILAFILVSLVVYGAHAAWSSMDNKQRWSFAKISGKTLMYSLFSVAILAGLTLLF